MAKIAKYLTELIGNTPLLEISNYEKKDNAKKIYFVDLSTKFNSPYVSDKSNKKPTKASEVQVKDSALVLIKNGKVSKYYESVTDYEKVLN